MQPNQIEMNILTNKDYGEKIIQSQYEYFAQAAATCLEENGFRGSAVLHLKGDVQAEMTLNWEPLSTNIKDMNHDLVDATERGACCIAFLMIHQWTPFKILRQSRRKTGFDYWLTDKTATFPFRDTARLEISGILNGDRSEIKSRIKQKETQINQSAALGLPAYIIVTEFSQPLSTVKFK